MAGKGTPVPFTAEPIVELLSVGPFGGLDATTLPYYVADTNATAMVNVVPNRQYAGYVTAQGRVPFPLSPVLSSTPTGLTKFMVSTAPVAYLATTASTVPGTAMQIQQFLATGGPPTSLATPVPLTQSPGKFVPYGQWMFFSDGIDTPLKIDQNVNVTYWQPKAPATPPTVSAGLGTNLTGTYYYSITFGNPVLETSQGATSNPITLNAQSAALSNVPTSSDPQVTQRNVYRLGGTLAQWRLVGIINDNVTTTFNDNTADSFITGQLLIVSRDPPDNFSYLESHKERIWGFGIPNTDANQLWYSNYEEPWGFNAAQQVFEVGNNQNGDYAQGLASIGSLLVLFKNYTTWVVYGDTPNDFLIRKLFDIGCIAPLSIAKAYGMVFWLSEQGVYVFSGAQPTNISDGNVQQGSLKGILDAMTTTDFQAAAGFVFDRTYFLSFPTKGQTYGYDMRQQTWYPLGFATPLPLYILENREVTAASLTVPGQIDSWFAAETDYGNPITAAYQSKISDSGALYAKKTYRYICVEAPIQPGASCTVTLITDPGSTPGIPQGVYQKTFDLSQHPSTHIASIPNTLPGSSTSVNSGYAAQLVVSTSSSQETFIEKVSLFGWVKREYAQHG